MRKIRETDVKLHLHDDKVYVEYESVMEIIKRHDLLVDELREADINYEKE